MNKLLVWISILLVGVYGGKELVDYLSRSANESAATARVEGFLRGMSPGGDFQEAFNLWKTGGGGAIQSMTQEQYNAEVGHLYAWLTGRQLGRQVERFEILKATMVAPPEGLDAAAVAVSCKINGRPFTILAVKYEQLAWMD